MKEVLKALRAGERFLIATHLNPDGDALGSALALALALEQTGKDALLYDRDGVPEYLRFLPGWERVRTSLEGLDTGEMTLVLLDCNIPKRAAVEEYAFKASAIIDHHENPSEFGDVRWVEPGVPAVGIMIYRLIGELGVKVTPGIATNLYAAIAVDTGTFRFSNTTSESLRIAAELVDAGAIPGDVAHGLYQTWSRRKYRLLCMNLESMELTDSVGMSAATREMFEATGTAPEDTENFVNFPLMMEDVKVSAMFRETGKDTWRVSLRSKGDLDVAQVARRFGGGGHINAAGCEVKGDLDTVKRQVRQAVEEML